MLTEAEAARVADVFTTHQRFIENVARQHAISAEAVPDIVQDVAVQVCTSLNGFRGECELQTWLYRVTVNLARNNYHRERRHQRSVEAVLANPDPEPAEDPDQVAMSNQRLEALRAAVGKLRQPYRGAITSQIGNGTLAVPVKTEEGTKDATVRKRRWHARQHLRVILADDPRIR